VTQVTLSEIIVYPDKSGIAKRIGIDDKITVSVLFKIPDSKAYLD
jgi:ethanolamine utilization microcompartment shell protein EutS